MLLGEGLRRRQSLLVSAPSGPLGQLAGRAGRGLDSALFGLASRWSPAASRAVGGGVVAASDETFAEKENLVTAAPATHAAHTFGHKGQVYDGWETRRRRDSLGPDGDDWAVVRLGLPGTVHRVVIDTAFFDGNHPVSADVDTCWIEGHPTPAEVVAARCLAR